MTHAQITAYVAAVEALLGREIDNEEGLILAVFRYPPVAQAAALLTR